MESIVLGIYLWFKIYFLIDTNTKMWTKITDLVVLGRNYWSSCRVYLANLHFFENNSCIEIFKCLWQHFRNTRILDQSKALSKDEVTTLTL